MNDLVLIKDLAADLGMDRSHCRRYVLGLKIVPKKARARDTGNQLALAVTRDEADRVRAARSTAGYSADGVTQGPVDPADGYFYVIRPDPNQRPGLIKIGFSNDVARRCATFRTVCPFAEVIATYPCRRYWEQAIIDAVQFMPGVTRVHNSEVHDCEDVEAMLARLAGLFQFFHPE